METRSRKKGRSNSAANPPKNAKRVRIAEAPDKDASTPLKDPPPKIKAPSAKPKGMKKTNSQASTAKESAEPLPDPQPELPTLPDPFEDIDDLLSNSKPPLSPIPISSEPATVRPHEVHFYARVFLDQKELDPHSIYDDINDDLPLTWYRFKKAIASIMKAYTAARPGFPTYYMGKWKAFYSAIRSPDKVVVKDHSTWDLLLHGLRHRANTSNVKNARKVDIICQYLTNGNADSSPQQQPSSSSKPDKKSKSKAETVRRGRQYVNYIKADSSDSENEELSGHQRSSDNEARSIPERPKKKRLSAIKKQLLKKARSDASLSKLIRKEQKI
jgi:hypothetical protein